MLNDVLMAVFFNMAESFPKLPNPVQHGQQPGCTLQAYREEEYLEERAGLLHS